MNDKKDRYEPLCQAKDFIAEDEVKCVLSAMPSEEALDDISDLFKLFSDSTRIKILFVLLKSEQCVCAISEILGMTQSAISHQLRLLRQGGLVKSRREGKSIFYSLADSHVSTMLSQGLEHIEE